ncbi:MAG TPA: DinB family protein [Thermoanaerobaculia bacterium]
MDPIDAVEEELKVATRRAWALVQSTDGRLFTVRPDPSSWSAAECLAHLSISTEQFLPRLEATIERARASGRSGRTPRMDVIGKVLRWFLEPPIRSRVKTTAPFVPRSTRAKAEAFGEFAALQDRLLILLTAARGLDLRKPRLVSPFDPRVRYNAFSAFRILAAHQRRHLWQAEQAVASLKVKRAS